MAKLGIAPQILAPLPTNHKSFRVKEEDKKNLIFEKLEKYIIRGYLVLDDPSAIKNYIDYFHVPKGETDIRLVFNGTSCGLNDATWSSRFWLPMSTTMTRLLSYNYKVVDMDLGEMFLNFPIHNTLKYHVGVDLTPFREFLKPLVPLYVSPHFLKEKKIA